jgi:hypothetical protein
MDPQTPLTDYTQVLSLQEVAYVMRPQPDGSIGLWRGQRPFSRNSDPSSFFVLGNLDQPGYLDANFQLVDDTVLYVDYRFWTEWTFDGNMDNPFPQRPAEANQVPPVRRWDSTRAFDPNFELYTGKFNANNPDFIMPILTTVVIELEATGARGEQVKLSEDIDENVQKIPIERGELLPDAPGHVLIGEEWVKYKDKDEYFLYVESRGARGTGKTPHAFGDVVRYSRAFSTSFTMPLFRRTKE